MQVKAKFDHVNFNITDIERSVRFYADALGFQVLRTLDGPEGAFKLLYLGTPGQPFSLELTWLKDHPQPYELGENESHLAVRVDGDYDAIREYHRQMGCICFENEAMGLYFIHDPDDYWIEILPAK